MEKSKKEKYQPPLLLLKPAIHDNCAEQYYISLLYSFINTHKPINLNAGTQEPGIRNQEPHIK